MLIAISSMMVQSDTNTFSNEVIAGIGVAEKVVNWGQMGSLAFSSAAMAIVAQNVGAGKYDRVKEAIKECLIISNIFTICSIVVLYFSAPYLISRFNQNELVIMYGTQMVRYAIFSMVFINLSHVYNAACRAAGNVRFPMYIAIFSQVFCKFIFVYIGLKIYYDVHVLYLGSAFGYTMAGILATLYFYRSTWTLENGLRV